MTRLKHGVPQQVIFDSAFCIIALLININMRVVKANSKKFFRESVVSQFNGEYVNKKIVNKAIKILENSLFGSSNSQLDKIDNFRRKGWNELVNFLKNKNKLSQKEISYVMFLERYVIGCTTKNNEEEAEVYLMDYRQSVRGIPNTCCYSCGLVIVRNTSQKNIHYCAMKENESCYKTRKEKVLKNDRDWKLLKFVDKVFKKPRCAKCKKLVTYFLDQKNYFFDELPFCCREHMESYRKNEQRRSKK